MSQATGVKTVAVKESPKEAIQNHPTLEQIRERAYEIYVARNGTPGDELHDWLQAEQELRSK